MQTGERAPANLPRSLTSLIEREHELTLAQRLLRDGQRLLTLTGPGGVGKTRLSVALAGATADLFSDGVVFVSLAPILDPALVPRVVAAAFELPDPDASQVVAALTANIADKRVLLVLDNFEHLLPAATVVPTLLATCQGLRVVATSRSPLQVVGEYLLPVPTLGLPDSARVEDLARSEAASCSLPGRGPPAANSI
jgi:predicted ATPase